HTVTVNYGSECTTEIVVNVAAGREFSASITNPVNISCFGGNDGGFVVNASNFDPIIGFAYSVNGVEYAGPFTGPQTVSGLTAQVHNVAVWDLRDVDCDIPLTQDLTEPAVLTATASITTPFTCDNTGATITVVAGGGTPSYEYSLDGTTYQTSAIFMDVAAGSYTITVRDANLCSFTLPAPITVDVPEAPVFTATPIACYSGNNDGEIVVNVTGGNGGLLFSINGGPFQAPNPVTADTYTFTNLGSGDYTIEVKDQYGCTVPAQTINIAREL